MDSINPKSVSSEVHRSFTLFPNLPVEVRLQVWNEASRIPRIVRIKDSGKKDDPLRGEVSPIFLICREAREEILRRDADYLNRYETENGRLEKEKKTLFVNVEKDVFWLEECDVPIIAWTRSLIWPTATKLLFPARSSLPQSFGPNHYLYPLIPITTPTPTIVAAKIQNLALPYQHWALLRTSYGLKPPWIMTLELSNLYLIVNNRSSNTLTNSPVDFDIPEEIPSSFSCAEVIKRWKTVFSVERAYQFRGEAENAKTGTFSSWEDMATNEEKELERLRAIWLIDEQDRQRGTASWGVDLKKWKAPRIRFVDVLDGGRGDEN